GPLCAPLSESHLHVFRFRFLFRSLSDWELWVSKAPGTYRHRRGCSCLLSPRRRVNLVFHGAGPQKCSHGFIAPWNSAALRCAVFRRIFASPLPSSSGAAPDDVVLRLLCSPP